MIRTKKRLIGIIGESDSYQRRVLATVGCIAYLPLSDLSGIVASEIKYSNNWEYTNGPTLNQLPGPGDGHPWVAFDGSDDYVVPTAGALAALNTAGMFNPDEFSVGICCELTAPGAWGDGNYYVLLSIGADDNNIINFSHSAANTFEATIITGGSLPLLRDQVGVVGGLVSAWIVASRSANISRAYFNGVQVGADAAFAGNPWVGALASTHTRIGAYRAPGYYWPGLIGRVALYNRMLSPAEVVSLTL